MMIGLHDARSVRASLAVGAWVMLLAGLVAAARTQTGKGSEAVWQPLFDGKTLTNWQSTKFIGEGAVKVENGQIILEAGGDLTGITWIGPELPTTSYEIALQAMRVGGSDFFAGVTFPVADSFCSLILGGWGGTVVGLSSINGMDASENETSQSIDFESGRWYGIRIRVTPAKIEAWLDERQIINQDLEGKKIDIRVEVERSRPLGVASWRTKSALRDFRLRRLYTAARPVAPTAELGTDLYINPQPVTIEGYGASAMEPFIAPDSRSLFFNNVNDPGVDTNLHVATRIGPRAFRYVGEVAGVNSPVLDAVASMDVGHHFYFTSVRQYDRDLKSIFVGIFEGWAVRDVRPVEGSLLPALPGHINMDVSISPDGQTLYVSRARFAGGTPVPRQSDLLIAHRAGVEFMLDSRSDELLARVNTPALEYAPAISADGLELYFTRASQLMAGRSAQGAKLRIMVARRPRADAPFDEPRVLETLDGFVEAPSLSLDGREMFFHKKIDGRFVIYRAERRSTPLVGARRSASANRT